MKRPVNLVVAGMLFTVVGNNLLVIRWGGEMAMQAMGALLIGWAILIWMVRWGIRPFLQGLTYFWPVLLYYGYVLFALVAFLPGGLRGILTLSQYALAAILTGCFLPVAMLIGRFERQLILRRTYLICLVLAVSAILGSLLPYGIADGFFSQKSSYRLFGIFQASGGVLEHMITLSVQLMLGLFLARWLHEQQEQASGLVFKIGLMVLLLGLFVTMGRSGWVGAASGFTIGAVVRRNPLATLVNVVATVCVVSLGFYTLYELALEIDIIARVLRIDYGLSNRQYLWAASWDMVQQKPMGWGFRAPQTELAYLFSSDFAPRSDIGGAGNHNTFLDVLMAYGAPAVVLYYNIFLVAIFNLTRATRIDASLRRLLFSTVTGALVASHFITFNVGGLRFTSLCINILLGLALLSPLVGRPGFGGPAKMRS